jgi:DNA uptake protein ComE-like DNA-binding protein
MKLISGPVKNWFGFSRRERRATFVLLILIVLISGIRYFVPDSRMSVRDITGEFFSADDSAVFFQRFSTTSWGNSSSDGQNEHQVKYSQKKLSDYKAVILGGKTSGKENAAQNPSLRQRPLTDINLSDSAALDRLPGIGPVLSARIIKYRRLLGGFACIEQLKEIYGLPAETYELIKGKVFADSTFIKRININTCVYRDLVRIPYFEKYEVTAILKYREIKGRINSMTDLAGNKLITTDKAKRVGPYLKFAD